MMTTAQEFRDVLLDLLPEQGQVSEEEYLWLTDHTNRLLEYTDGYVEVLPMPTSNHQRILFLFARAFFALLDPHGGIVLFAPLRLRLRREKFREPDLLVLLDAADPRFGDHYWTGADLVLEVVSPDKPERDLVEKRRDYAAAGIPEYWIVNPLNCSIVVLVLSDGAYREHGPFSTGMVATSVALPEFSIGVDEVFGVAK